VIDLEKSHPDLITPDSPSQRVGGEPLSELQRSPCGSDMSIDTRI